MEFKQGEEWIMKLSSRVVAIVVLAIISVSQTVIGQTTSGDKNYLKDPESLIRELYKSVSMKPGEKYPDWDKVADLFHEKAVVTIRTSKTAFGIFDRQGFINDFKTFYESIKGKSDGFGESIAKMKTVVTGDIADIVTLYEARIYGPKGITQQGVDGWQLIQKDGRWWIISIINEVIGPKAAIPEILK
jgi:hypothetical protein